MHKFLWINPVAASMYGGKELDEQLLEKGYERVDCREDHIGMVKEKYRLAFESACTSVGDVRCPMAVEYIKENYAPDCLEFPAIEPILLHCARELHKRYSGQGSLWIITPCLALAQMGNRLHMTAAQFLTWKEFSNMENICLRGKRLTESPIPPGFFSGYKDQPVVLDSREKIDDYFPSGCVPNQKRLYELLYCSGGCHHGDGV